MLTLKQKGTRGFSLVEVMVASLIFLIILGTILNIYISGSEVYENNKIQADLQAQARMGLNSMTSELSNATKTTPPIGASPPNIFIPAAPGNNTMTFYLPVLVQDPITFKPRVSISAGGAIVWNSNVPVVYQYDSGQRTLFRTSGGAQTVIARDVASVLFTNVSNFEVMVVLTLSKNTPRGRSISTTLSSIIRLRN